MKKSGNFKLSYKKRFVLTSILFFLFFGIVILILAQRNDRISAPYELSSNGFDTYIDQHIYSSEGSKISEEVLLSLGELQNRLSWRGENGDIWKINNIQYAPVSVDKETVSLIAKLGSISEQTNGAYDFTNLSTVRVWGFDTAVQLVPESSAVSEAVKKHGYKNIIADEEALQVTVNTKTACLYLEDIIKGAAVDNALEIYESHSTDGALISIGECMGATEKADGNGWNVPLRDPNGTADELLGTIRFASGCIATKAEYQRFFVEDNKVYHAILNPANGMPANSGICSAAVLSDSGVLSEAVAYAVVVSGADKIAEYSETFGVQILAVSDDGKVYITGGLKDKFSLTAENYNLNII